MTTKHEAPEPSVVPASNAGVTRPETSVLLALAELDRIERERASFAGQKRDAHAQLGRQARELESLRARLLAERPRAWTRARKARLERSAAQQRALAQHSAGEAAEHHARMLRAQAALEDKRRQLAALEASPEPVRPARRMLEWSVPAAATVLVAFLGMFALGETEAVARTPELLVGPAPMLMAEPGYAPFEAQGDAAVLPPAPAPAKATNGKPGKPRVRKPASQPPSTPKPIVKKNSNPIELGSFGDDPLG